MKTSIGPALAFYFRNGAAVDVLRELEARPDTVEADDWAKFHDVIERASLQVEQWLDAAREDALAVLAPHARASSRGRTTKKDWASWAELEPKKPLKTMSKKLYIGVVIGTDEKGHACYAPYVATTGGEEAHKQICERLVQAGFAAAAEPREWFGSDAVALDLVPLDASSDIVKVTTLSTTRFAELAACWGSAFGR